MNRKNCGIFGFLQKGERKMANFFKILLFSGIIILLSVGCTIMETKDTIEETRDAMAGDTMEGTVQMTKYFEDCMELLPGQKMEYSFETAKPVNFNIHYHEEKDIIYPISKEYISELEGIFHCEKKQYYCLMWTSPYSEPITLTYKCKIVKR